MGWQATRSHENLKAGEAALAAGYVNVAASRFYYALYHRIWDHLERHGQLPVHHYPAANNERDRWTHGFLRGQAKFIAKFLLGSDQSRDVNLLKAVLRQLYDHRVSADYKPWGPKRTDVADALSRLKVLLEESDEFKSL